MGASRTGIDNLRRESKRRLDMDGNTARWGNVELAQ